ncbi:MAG: tetratricopeptide repeat protein [Alphaproteobacteria bacterium]
MLDQINYFSSEFSFQTTRDNGQTWLFAQSSNSQTGAKSECLTETSRIVGPIEEKFFGPLGNRNSLTNRNNLATPSTRSFRELIDLCQKEMALSLGGEIEYRIFILMEILGGDVEKGIFYLRKSAEKGNTKGQSVLGYCHYLGNVVEKNIALAIFYLEKSANAGFLFSTIQLSIIYRELELEPERFKNIEFDKVDSIFLGKRESVPRWIYWLQRASELDTKSALQLARLYERGQNVHKDEEIAIRLYSLASDRGSLEGSVALGAIYLRRGDDPEYLARAMMQIEHSAKLGHHPSQLIVGRAYLKGTGVSVDLSKAEFWLRKSSHNGDLKAKEILEKYFSDK